MRHPVKLFGLIAIATLITPTIQAPGFSKTIQQIRLQQATFPVLAQAPSDSDRQAEADRLFQQGIGYYQDTRYQEALQVWEQALAIYREVGDRNAEEKVLGGLGNAYFSLEDYEKASEFYGQQFSLIREMGNRGGEGRVQVSLGWAYSLQGKYQLAIDYFEKALAISEETGDTHEKVI